MGHPVILAAADPSFVTFRSHHPTHPSVETPMIRRGIALSLAFMVFSAASARSEAVAIDHKAVGCIVVGKYPKMNACFSPAADLARSRVYFRPEGVASWYYVDMKTEQPCFTGTLPRPGKKLVGKKIEYYLEAQNKAFEPARTAEFAPIVVKSAQECKKDVPVAPFLNNATVAVFPSVPAGFVGSTIGTAAVVGIVGAGAAAASTAAIVASNNDDNTTTTTTPVAVNPTTTTTVVAATTTTTTTLPPASNRPPFAVLSTSPDPPSGNEPLTVTFDLCKSTDPENRPLNFFFDFGDGGKSSGSCNVSHTYSAGPFRAAGNVRALDKSYGAQACVVDSGELSACRERNVNVTTTPPPTSPPTTTPCPAPTANIENAGQGVGCSIFFQVSATNTDAVTVCATLSGPCTKGLSQSQALPTSCASGSEDGDWFGIIDVSSIGDGCYDLIATATNSCGGSANSAPFTGVGVSCSALRKGEVVGLLWTSDLRLDGGRLQVVVNGSTSSYPERGRSVATARIKDGDNRLEATVVDSGGKPGSWTIDLSASAAIQPGSIRVLAGEIESMGAAAVTFRLKGTPGERLALTFVKK